MDHLLAEFGLTELAQAHPFTLSGGEKRRLSVAAALALPRKVLYLDEPTFGQDARNAAALMEHMRALAAKGTAVVLASHDMELVAEHTDRVLLLREGRVTATGDTRQVLKDADTLESAGLPVTELASVSSALFPGRAPWLTWRDVPTPPGTPAAQSLQAQKRAPVMEARI